MASSQIPISASSAGGGYQAVQLRCPFCNGAASGQPGETRVCEYCLQPFTIAQAQNEADRLRDEIKSWLDEKLGSSTNVANSSADVSSRLFIFQQRVLPDLRRDVNRAMERVGSFGHHAL